MTAAGLKTKLSLVELLAKLARWDSENESLNDLTESDEELVGDFEDEDEEIGFLNSVVTHNASVDPVHCSIQTNILLDELDSEVVTYTLIIFMHHQNCYQN